MVQPTDLLEVFHPVKQKVNFERPLSPAQVNGAGRSWLIQKYLPPGASGRHPVSYRHSRLESLSQPADNGLQTRYGLQPDRPPDQVWAQADRQTRYGPRPGVSPDRPVDQVLPPDRPADQVWDGPKTGWQTRPFDAKE